MAYKILEDSPEPSSISPSLLHRVPTQAATGVATEIAGLPGNLLSPVHEYVAAPLSKLISGQEQPSYESSPIGRLLPTSSKLKSDVQKNVPYLKPKNKLEQFSSDVVSDATSLFLPGKVFKAGVYAMTPLRSLGSSIAAGTLGQATEAFTGDQSKGNLARSGALLGLSLFNKPKAQQIAGAQYDKARSLLPASASTDATRLESGLNKIKKDVLQGRGTADLAPSEKFVIDEADKILRQIDEAGDVNMSALVAAKRSLNEMLNKLVFESPDKAAKAGARKLAKRINGEIRGTFKEYGTKNPEWLKAQSEADGAFGAISQSNYISRVLEKVLKGRVAGLHGLFGASVPVAASLASGPGAVAGVAGYQAAKLLHRVMNSPLLRRHYAKVIKSASTENTKLLNKEVDSFEEAIKKSEKTEEPKYRILD